MAVGRRAAVLVLHGGPGMSCEYMEGIVGELDGFAVGVYQQRGLPPSTLDGPFAVAQEVADLVAVLDALGWERAWLVGHSWGGHLLAHALASVPERLLGGLAIDPLGAVGDGGWPAMDEGIMGRLPEEERRLAMEIDERSATGEASEEEQLELLRLAWPAYFATWDAAPPFRPMRLSPEAFSGLLASILEEMPGLEARLGEIGLPFGCVAGAASPLPPAAAALPTAAAIPGGWVEIVEGAGHMPWIERPGCVAAALRRLVAQG